MTANKASELFKLVKNPNGPDITTVSRPMKETHLETTLSGIHKLAEIAAAVHAKGGKAYAYRDTSGNYYELNFGLRY